jgi:metal-dependent amidase/aminoacylase/carboxypeptidase family protein
MSAAAEPYALPDALAERLRQGVEERRAELIRVSRSLHDNPETAWQEVRSAALLADTLEAGGFCLERGVAGLPTAFTASTGPEDAAARAAVVAEYDALPGLGHACGHNVIAAAALGAALALRPLLGELSLALTVVGTAAALAWSRHHQARPPEGPR